MHNTLFELCTLTQQMQPNVLKIFLDYMAVAQANKLPLFGECA
jgi:hypothetical protein